MVLGIPGCGKNGTDARNNDGKNDRTANNTQTGLESGRTQWAASELLAAGLSSEQTLSKLALIIGLMKWSNYLVTFRPECGRIRNFIDAHITVMSGP